MRIDESRNDESCQIIQESIVIPATPSAQTSPCFNQQAEQVFVVSPRNDNNPEEHDQAIKDPEPISKLENDDQTIPPLQSKLI